MFASDVRTLDLTLSGFDVADLTAGMLGASFDGIDFKPVDSYTAPVARVTIGPGTPLGAPPVGDVDVWVQVTAPPERYRLVHRGALTVEEG
jgi:hypothetical protein